MTSLILFLLLAAPHVLLLVVLRRHRQACAEPSSPEVGTGVRDVLTWSALDDHQLTRLLADSAARDATGS